MRVMSKAHDAVGVLDDEAHALVAGTHPYTFVLT